MKNTETAFSLGAIVAIVVYFAVRFAIAPAQPAPVAPLAISDQPLAKTTPAPQCPNIRKVSLGLDYVHLEVFGPNAQALSVTFDNGLTLTRPTLEVCSFGECKIKTGANPGTMRLGFDKCPVVVVN